MLAEYHRLFEENAWEHDPIQDATVTLLDMLQQNIANQTKGIGAWGYNLFALRKYMLNHTPLEGASGVYIWGGVGRGKTMLMDLFFKTLSATNKQRYHFHDFMHDFHANLQAVNGAPGNDARILLALRNMLGKIKVLCLDELQVNNIADAMVMGRIFNTLFAEGVCVVITSNRHPTELFKDGLQRERFLPFIDAIMQKCTVIDMNGGVDYRLLKIPSLEQLYHHPLNHDADQFLATVKQTLIGPHEWAECTLTVDDNRSLLVLRSYGYIAMFSFAELCKMPMGAADYRAICQIFNTVIIENIPQMGFDNHNEALRFITLIDCLYDSKTKLICTAEAPYDQLYTGRINRFEFDRTTSRLRAMQTEAYLSTPKYLY